MRARAFLTTLVLSILVAACAWPFGRKEDDEDFFEGSREITVHVTNHNWQNVVIYAVRGGSRVRLGDVVTGQSVTFTIPHDLVEGGGQISLLVDPIGGSGRYSTGAILVSPGQQIELTVENHLPTSSWSVGR
jgi:hypothetical protein